MRARSIWVQATYVPLNEIARKVSASKGLTVVDIARLFALLNIALADSRVATWDAKFTYNFWRPVTALNEPPVRADAGPLDEATLDAAADVVVNDASARRRRD